jgi:hypothetical protein
VENSVIGKDLNLSVIDSYFHAFTHKDIDPIRNICGKTCNGISYGEQQQKQSKYVDFS